MRRAAIAVGASALALVALALAAGHRAFEKALDRGAATPPAPPPVPAPAPAGEEAGRGQIHGRITTVDGATYTGRLRWGGGNEEAFWGDYFNGRKDENPWAAQVAPERLPQERRPIEVFGIEIASRERRVDLGRLFMGRFGDLARIEPRGGDVRVTLKSGTAIDLDRLSASDFDDDVRVWDGTRGVVDLDSRRIRTIELLAFAGSDGAPDRLHGTVRTRKGDFTGFVQWDREKGAGSDRLDGHTAGGELSLRFDTLRSLARRSSESCLVTRLDGREIVLSGTRAAGKGNRGVYVDDRRYGRVLVSWDAFERLDFSPGGWGPAYDDFPPGRPLTGRVTTRAGRRLAGRLVYDLDESETTETLDAPSQGVDYTILFGLVASIALGGPGPRDAGHVRVTLHGGEELRLEPKGDLGEGNAGLLVFVDGRERPEYVPWSDVQGVDLDPPPATIPPLDGPAPASSPGLVP